jgi:hypothetical protein
MITFCASRARGLLESTPREGFQSKQTEVARGGLERGDSSEVFFVQNLPAMASTPVAN